MLSKLILSAPLLLFVLNAPQAQNGAGPRPQAPGSAVNLPSTPPVKMGLWEATVTNSRGATYKSRSCYTSQDYERSLANMPPGCTLSNQAWTSHSFSGDVACTMQQGSSNGHIDVQFPDTETIHSTISITMTMQGQTIPMNITTDSHFVSSDCGGLAGGKTQQIH